MKAFAAVGIFLVAFPALADVRTATGVHDVPPLSALDDIYTWISASPAPIRDNPCAIEVDRELKEFLATAVMQAGFPNAAPTPVYIDPPEGPITIKPSFTVEATTTFQDSSCLLAMRAEMMLGGDQRLVFWSSPLVILKTSAGPDSEKPSEALNETFKKMPREMARVFVLAWRGVKVPMHVPD